MALGLFYGSSLLMQDWKTSDHPQYEKAKELGNAGYVTGGILAIDCESKEKAEELYGSAAE
jgi:hypothetical protein